MPKLWQSAIVLAMPQSGSLLTTGEAAERIGLSTDLVRDLAARGLLRVLVLPSGHRRFWADDIDRFIEEHINTTRPNEWNSQADDLLPQRDAG